MNPQAALSLVATPIGHRDDITLRAIEQLKTVDIIAAEDTRHTGALLRHHQINTPCFSLHQHNEQQRIHYCQTLWADGKHIALVSDAGTPLISDPGFPVVQQAHQLGVTVHPIPGPCAAIAALSASGLPANEFLFVGFLPRQPQAKQKRLAALAHSPHTLIFYESKHRVVETLMAMSTVFKPDCSVCIARELTKTFETIRRDTLQAQLIWLQDHPEQRKGEFVVLLDNTHCTPEHDSQRILTHLLAQLPLKQAVSLAAELTGQAKNQLYQQALHLQRANLRNP